MEEQIKVDKITLKFHSSELNRLKVALYDQNDQLFQICTLLQNRRHQIEPNTKLSYIYCVINAVNKTQDFTFQISLQQTETGNLIEREFEFDEFDIQIQMQTRRVSADFFQSQQILADKANLQLAKSNLLKIRQKVLFTLTKENFIKAHKRKSRLMTKAKVRRSKTKKNLTAIFFRNVNNDLTVYPLKKQSQRSEINLNSAQNDTKNNDSAKEQPEQSSNVKSKFRFNHLFSAQKQISENKQQARPQQKINESKITQKNEDNIEKSWCKKYCNGTLKNKYLRTLQTQTLKQLNTQKEQLQFLRTLTSKENIPIIRVHAPKQVLTQTRTQELKKAYRLASKPKKQIK